MFINKANITKTLIFVISFIFLYVAIGFIYSFELKAQVSPQPINQDGGFLDEGSWSSAIKPEEANNIIGGYIDTVNNKLWLFDSRDGVYYRSINSQGIPEGNWSSAGEPPVAIRIITGGYIDTTNNKLWLFDHNDGVYYRSINSQGVPYGSWSSLTKPEGARSIAKGYIDTTNNKLWLFDYYDGAYYRSINSQGAPVGSWVKVGEPEETSNITGGYIDTTNNKLWLFDYYDGAYYRSINSQGAPVGSWVKVGEPEETSNISGGYVDTTNNKLWLFDYDNGAYYRSINSQGIPQGNWVSVGEPTTASVIEGGYIDTTNNKLWLFDYYNGDYYRSIDTINTGSNDGNSSGVPASNTGSNNGSSSGAPASISSFTRVSNNTVVSTVRDPAIYDGDLIKTSTSPDIYIVKFINGKRFRRLILNPDIFNSYGHLSWDNVKIISQYGMNLYTVSDLVREVYPDGSIVPPGNVYKVYPQGDTGRKRLIRVTQAEFESEFDKDSIYNINHLEASEAFYRRGQDITVQNLIIPSQETPSPDS